MKWMFLTLAMLIVHFALGEVRLCAADASQTEKVRGFIRLVLDGKVGATKDEVISKFTVLANEDPTETVKALFEITQQAHQAGSGNASMGVWAVQLAQNGPFAGDVFWKALASELNDAASRESAFKFIDLSGKREQVYVGDENMPEGYWAAAFAYAPMATIERLRQFDVEQNGARYGMDEAYRQNMVDKFDAATMLVQLYVDLCGRAVSSKASEAVCADIHGATMTQLRFLAGHEKWWVRRYAVDAMRRCKGLRLSEDDLGRMVALEKDPRVLPALSELSKQ